MNISRSELANKINDDSFITQVSKNYFRSYDKNGDKYIAKKELMIIMTDISKTYFGCLPEKSAIEAQFKKIDRDKNEKIDFAEFKSFIKEFLKMIVDFNI